MAFDPAVGEQMLADVHRFMVLTYQIREEDAAGTMDVGPTAPHVPF